MNRQEMLDDIKRKTAEISDSALFELLVFTYQQLEEVAENGFNERLTPEKWKKAKEELIAAGLGHVMTQPKLTTTKEGSLVGRWFHSFHPVTKKVDWQGQIVANPSPTTYLVHFYSWLDGGPTNQQFVELEQMKDWQLYDNDDDWRAKGGRLFAEAMQALRNNN